MITDNEILRYIGKQSKHTAGFKQLIHDLGIRGRDRRTVQDTLRHMVRRKKLVAIGKERWGLPTSASSQNLVVGTLRMHRDGENPAGRVHAGRSNRKAFPSCPR